MAKLLLKVRNNWKKTVFGVCSISYGTYYLIDRKHNADLLQAYCHEALKYSHEKVRAEQTLKKVTVFLNPVANKESGRFSYERNVAPLLHLSGLDVRVVRLEKNTEAKEYMKELDMSDTDCVVIAGGNSTISECITGLMSRADRDEFLERISIGVIPIGATNTFAKKWFFNPGDLSAKERELRMLADSAMSVIRGETTKSDLIHISLDEHTQLKPAPAGEKPSFLEKNKELYALSEFTTGFVTETDAHIDHYWYIPFVKAKINRYFMDRYLRRQPVKFDYDYKLKCAGCSRCLNQAELSRQLNALHDANKLKKANNTNKSLLQIIYSKLFTLSSIRLIESKDVKEARLLKIKKVENLLEKSKLTNVDCEKLFKSNLTQTQVYARVNNENLNGTPSGIESILVKDPEFNLNAMFLAEKKLIKEFFIKKWNKNERGIRFKRDEDNVENVFSVQVDGEIVKLDNSNEANLALRVRHVEKCLNLLRHDCEYAMSVRPNPLSNVYLLRRSEKERIVQNEKENRPTIKPLERLYLKFWNAENSSANSQSS